MVLRLLLQLLRVIHMRDLHKYFAHVNIPALHTKRPFTSHIIPTKPILKVTIFKLIFLNKMRAFERAAYNVRFPLDCL